MPYLAYDQFDFAVPVRTEGDVLARVVVRAQEIVESCNIIEQALAQMPAGSLHAGDIYSVPAGEAVVRVEAPRGEVFYYVESDGSDVPSRVKVRTPTFANIPSVDGNGQGKRVRGYAPDPGCARPLLFVHGPVNGDGCSA